MANKKNKTYPEDCRTVRLRARSKTETGAQERGLENKILLINTLESAQASIK